METKELSIIIVNYNGKHYLKDCLDSIANYCSSISNEIIIVDNNSSDGSQEYLKENYPGARLFEEKKNLGFGKANNLGVKNSKGDYILLLNNDTILLQDIIPVIEIAKRSEVGAVGVKMLNGEQQYTASVGKSYFIFSNPPVFSAILFYFNHQFPFHIHASNDRVHYKLLNLNNLQVYYNYQYKWYLF
mgnify:CR=1 FL=1